MTSLQAMSSLAKFVTIVSKIIIIIIIVIVVYALISMRKKPASGQNTGQRQGNDPAGNPDPRDYRPSGQRKYGKWIGGGLGWAFGGPIGAILGFAMGSMFDGVRPGSSPYQGTARGDFSMSLLVLTAAVMRADKKIIRSELDYVRSFFITQFGEEEGARLMLLLREILKQEINIQDVSVQVGNYMEYSSRLQILHYLFGLASTDGELHPDEIAVIETIARYMGISAGDVSSIRAMFMKDSNWAYDVLEITKGASNDEVKKAYREMAKKHHPDKVAILGEDIRKAATEKFQKVNLAYEEIKKERGLN